MIVKKLKVHRPSECTCSNCCSNEFWVRQARNARKRRLVGPELVEKPNVAYKWRRILKEVGSYKLWRRINGKSKGRRSSRVIRIAQKPKHIRYAYLYKFRKVNP